MSHVGYAEETGMGQRVSDERFRTWPFHRLTLLGQISCLRLYKRGGGVANAIPRYYCFHCQIYSTFTNEGAARLQFHFPLEARTLTIFAFWFTLPPTQVTPLSLFAMPVSFSMGTCSHFLLQCMNVKREVKSLGRVQLSATPWTAAHQAPPSLGFSRQEYWSGVPLPSLVKMNNPSQIFCN